MIILMVCKGKLEGKYEIQSTLKDYMKQQETVFLKYAFTNDNFVQNHQRREAVPHYYKNVHVSAVNCGNISQADVLQ